MHFMSLSRRKTIATIAGLVTGGGIFSTDYGPEITGQSVSAQTPGTIEVTVAELPKRVAFVLDPSDFRTYQIVAENQAEISISGLVRWGSELDILTFPTTTEYQAYTNGYRAQYIEDLSAFGQLEFEPLSATIDNSVYLTVDNTDWQGEYPNIVSKRQAKKENLSKESTANNPDERSNATGDPSLPNEGGGLTVMGSGKHRAKVFIEISGSATTGATETPNS